MTNFTRSTPVRQAQGKRSVQATPDTYQRKALRTRARRARKAVALKAALAAYKAECTEARNAGAAMPKLSSFLEGK